MCCLWMLQNAVYRVLWTMSGRSTNTAVRKKRNSIISDNDQLRDDYFANVDTNMLDAPTSNSISVRILYFIDYSTMVKRDQCGLEE